MLRKWIVNNPRCVVFLVLTALLFAAPVQAGEADVVDVAVQATAPGVYRFDVTVRHADEGWGHYADAFEIVTPNGRVLGTRVLLHPHVAEQPFTRSLGGVRIPPGIDFVEVRAHDKVHGLGGKTVRVRLIGPRD